MKNRVNLIINNIYQEGAKHKETDKIDNGKVAAACEFFPRLRVRLWVTALSWKTGQHDLLPRFTRCTPAREEHKLYIYAFSRHFLKQLTLH